MVSQVRVLLIVNPLASGVGDRSLGDVFARLSAVSDLEVASTERAGHAAELAASLSPAEVAVAFGGDGTANEVVNGIAEGARFAVLPGGASSVLARQLGFSARPARAAGQLARSLASGRFRRLGVGTLDDRRFTFAASLGFDAEATRVIGDARRATAGNRRPGDWRVLAAAVRVLRADGYALHERMTIERPGGRSLRGSYVAIANQHPYSYFGPLPVRAVPHAGFESGLDAAVAGELRSRDLWRLAVYALVWPGHATGRDARVAYLHDVRDVRVVCDVPTAVQIDGEYVGHRDRVRLGYQEAAVDVYLAP
jgi:diacylglycerol kinase family enzyme